MAAHQAPPGILQARILDWFAISFSSARKWKVKMKSLSRVFATHGLSKLQEIVKDREAWHAAAQGSQRVGLDLMTEQGRETIDHDMHLRIEEKR